MPNNSRKDFDMTCKVLQSLFQRSLTLWNKGVRNLPGSQVSRRAAIAYQNLIEVKRPMSLGQFKKLVKEARKSKVTNLKAEWIYLPPLADNSDFVPVLSLEFDLGKPHGNIRFTVMMLLGSKTETAISYQGIAYRFELGHLGSGHDYYHVQFTNPGQNFGGNDDSLGCPSWIPTKMPRILTPAKGASTLILCVLLSFYGKVSPISDLLSNVFVKDNLIKAIENCSHLS